MPLKKPNQTNLTFKSTSSHLQILNNLLVCYNLNILPIKNDRSKYNSIRNPDYQKNPIIFALQSWIICVKMYKISNKGINFITEDMKKWNMCKEFKFNPPRKWFIHKPKYFLPNEIDKILLDSEIPTDHLISTRRPNLVIIYKREAAK